MYICTMPEDLSSEQQKLRRSFRLPVLFVSLLWLIYLLDLTLALNLGYFGTRPRQLYGLFGILTTPLLHANYEHLMSNSIPLLVLGPMICYFYERKIGRVLGMLYLLGGFWLWVLGKPDEVHIGASGLVYGLVSFLFFSGILTKHRGMMAVSLLTVFLYSSLALGIIPFLVPENVSWQGHLAGSFVGIVSAFYFRSDGPKPEEFVWEDEEQRIDGQQEDTLPPEIKRNPDLLTGITYHFVEKKKPSAEDKKTDNDKV